MTDILSTAASYQIVAQASPEIEVSAASYQVLVNFPAEEIQVSAANYTLIVEQTQEIEVSAASYQVICKGRTELPYIRAWTATLDGHDYYFLQLQDITLVYDLHSEQWYNWGSANREIWRGNLGVDWNANLGAINGGNTSISNILVGDYANGALYFLDTSLAEDMDETGEDNLPFQRLVYGQVSLRGHDYIPCNGVELTGSIGAAVSVSDYNVSLSFSDDQGNTFVNAGAVEIPNDSYDLSVTWDSLGSFRGPGRLFRIEDWGVLVRIDSLDMDDGKT